MTGCGGYAFPVASDDSYLPPPRELISKLPILFVRNQGSAVYKEVEGLSGKVYTFRRSEP